MNTNLRLFLWKCRYTFYMWRKSDMPISFCYQSAEASIENNPDDLFLDGPIVYAQEEMYCWSD